METIIRTGIDEDVPRCVALWTRVIVERDGAEHADRVASRARDAFATARIRFAVAGSPLRGFALTVQKPDGVASLSRLCVESSARSRGLGSALVADAVEHARRAGCRRIELDVRETNARASRLYAGAGFAAVSEPWDYDGGDPLVTWSLELAASEGGGEGGPDRAGA